MIPHDFVLDLLYPLPTRTRKMFGTVAIYSGEKILLATRKKDDDPIDNGIWVATKKEHHTALRTLIPELRNINIFKIQSWMLLHEDEDNFEERVHEIVDLIKSNSELIGNIPKPRKRKGKM